MWYCDIVLYKQNAKITKLYITCENPLSDDTPDGLPCNIDGGNRRKFFCCLQRPFSRGSTAPI